MSTRGITEDDVKECLENPVSHYANKGDIIYVFHDRQERMIKVRTRGNSPMLIIDVIRPVA